MSANTMIFSDTKPPVGVGEGTTLSSTGERAIWKYRLKSRTPMALCSSLGGSRTDWSEATKVVLEDSFLSIAPLLSVCFWPHYQIW
jgi:hypothetical protein